MRNLAHELREIDLGIRECEREIAKARAEALSLLDADSFKDRQRVVAHLVSRLDDAQTKLQVRALSQYRMEEAAQQEPWEPPGAPDDLVCKKCGEEKPPEEFFFDDGHGGYGFTRRCFSCRKSGRKQSRPAAQTKVEVTGIFRHVDAPPGA